MRAASFFLLTCLLWSCSDPPTVDNAPDSGGQPQVGAAALGAACASASDCKTGLCLTENTPLFSSGGPAGGICSQGCEAGETCPAGSVCAATLAGSRCLPGCDFGNDNDKCGGRDTLACEPLIVPSTRGCERDKDCQSGELCFESDDGGGVCEAVLGLCTPRCATDDDCGGGRFCEGASGECVAEEPSGLPLGASCDPSKQECAGRCVEVSPGVGECEERCRLGAQSGCGEELLSMSELICGFFAYDLRDLGIEQGDGDTGVCAKLCQCNADCPGDQRCLNNPVAKFAGLCAGGIALADSVVCQSGQGGAGGGGS